MEMSYDFCQRMKRMMDDNKAKVSTTLALMDMETNPSNEVIMKWMVSLAKSQVSGIDDMPRMVTEVVGEMDSMQEEVKAKEKEISKLRVHLEKQTTVVSSVVVTKDKLEVKASSNEMEERLRVIQGNGQGHPKGDRQQAGDLD